MVNECVSRWLCWLGGQPSFQIHGRGRAEEDWRTISVYATHRRNAESRWPLWRGTCITWTSDVIVVGWDFALELVREQMTEPASRQRPVEVSGGRLQNLMGRADAGAPGFPTVSEVLAHECGHTWQALRFRAAYLPIGATFTLFREGPHFWNRFENQASEQGLFGGIITRSVCQRLMDESTG